jgi:hypothetical protein
MVATLVKADEHGRVSICGARIGAKYLVTEARGGWWVVPAPEISTPEQSDPPAETWELRAATLESFYDPAKTW